VCNRGIMESSDERGRPLDEAGLSRLLLDNLTATPQLMVEMLRDRLPTAETGSIRQGRDFLQPPPPKKHDRSLLIVQRRPR
jgi:hypothetical protein